MDGAYSLGIDVGTTFTAAALSRGSSVETFSLGTYEVAVPSVVFASGEEMLFGSAAGRRGAGQPDGMAREFKRRVGDPVPLVLSGTPYHADKLTALMARWVLRTVTEQTGRSPDRVVMAHPANWTPFQVGALQTALSELGLDVDLITEPAAAALDYAATTTLPDGALLLVYDLGGGTFDVALLRRDGTGFEHQIEPFGIARLGGIDFDEAVFHFVTERVPREHLDAARRSPEGLAALANLRRQCVDAKVALSSDATADVPVILPGFTTSIRITRAELEQMIRPMVAQTIEAVADTLGRAGVDPADLNAVLLAGGSSRIPLVPQMVADRLGVPVRVDAHPKLVVAKGAARMAAEPRRGPPRRGAARVQPIDDDDDGGRSRLLVVIGAAVAVLALGGGALWALTRSDDPESTVETTVAANSAPAGSVVPVTTAAPGTTAPATIAETTAAPTTTTIDPAEAVFVAAPWCPVQPLPLDAVVVDDDVWVTSAQTATLQRCSTTTPGPPTDAVAFGQPSTGPDPLTGHQMVPANESLYITQRYANAVARVSLDDLAVETIPLDGSPFGAAVLDGTVWIGASAEGGGRLFPIDGSTVGTPIDIPYNPGYVQAIGDDLWAPSLGTHQLGRITPGTGEVAVFDVPGEPLDVLAVGDRLWVTLRQASQVAIIDPDTGAIVDQFDVPTAPHMLLDAFGAIWVSSSGGPGAASGTVSRIDPATQEPIQAPIDAGPGAVALTASDGALFVGDLGGDDVTILAPGG